VTGLLALAAGVACIVAAPTWLPSTTLDAALV
jgi:hypothetical protein